MLVTLLSTTMVVFKNQDASVFPDRLTSNHPVASLVSLRPFPLRKLQVPNSPLSTLSYLTLTKLWPHR